MQHRMTLRTRLGPALETELGNSWPIVEIFRDDHYDVSIDWSSVERVLDVGGHVGAFTTWAAARAPKARIETFEPEPRNFADLVANVERSGFQDRIALFNAAVGARDETRLLRVPPRRDMSSLTPGKGRGVEVECVALDRHIRECGREPIDILKLDCEGAEWEILPSLSEASLGRVRNFLVECHAREPSEVDAMASEFRAHGFVPSVLASGAGPDESCFLATLWAAKH